MSLIEGSVSGTRPNQTNMPLDGTIWLTRTTRQAVGKPCGGYEEGYRSIGDLMTKAVAMCILPLIATRKVAPLGVVLWLIRTTRLANHAPPLREWGLWEVGSGGAWS